MEVISRKIYGCNSLWYMGAIGFLSMTSDQTFVYQNLEVFFWTTTYTSYNLVRDPNL